MSQNLKEFSAGKLMLCGALPDVLQKSFRADSPSISFDHRGRESVPMINCGSRSAVYFVSEFTV